MQSDFLVRHFSQRTALDMQGTCNLVIHAKTTQSNHACGLDPESVFIQASVRDNCGPGSAVSPRNENPHRSPERNPFCLLTCGTTACLGKMLLKGVPANALSCCHNLKPSTMLIHGPYCGAECAVHVQMR